MKFRHVTYCFPACYHEKTEDKHSTHECMLFSFKQPMQHNTTLSSPLHVSSLLYLTGKYKETSAQKLRHLP